ncbi:MAG: FAD-dependent oxidoreductase [Actinobacteria bacterium]|nr:FAD-dependent oxidoreductase [Actinomycetota bacterium]
MTDSKFAKLLEPGQIGKVKTRNRIYKSAAGMMSFDETEMCMNENSLGFYEALSRGGVGIISVEAPTIDYPHGYRWRERYRMDEDRFVAGMAELVDLIHSNGCPCFMQMEHDGPWQNPLFPNAPATYEGPPIAASPVNIDSPGDFHRDLPRALTVPEIQDITRKYIDAAERAQKAGFDGIDINAGSSHIVHNFLSPFWNHRDDEYGGTQEKRAKLLVDILTGIKKRCGDDFPVVVCMNGFESGYCIGREDRTCLTHDLALQSMRMAVEAGADALMIRSHWLGLHVPGFLPDYMFFPDAQVPREKMPPQYNAEQRGRAAMRLMTAEAKKLFPIPVILIGYVTPEEGEDALEKGQADFIGMNRPLICDPELPNKLATGRREEVAPCTRCGTCLDQSESFLRHCRLNAAVGFGRSSLPRAEKKKKVVVVGGGPSGMEAARVAAHRGHDVTLVEKTSQLGGLLPLASLIKGVELEDIPGLIRYLKDQVAKEGVKVELGQEATVESVQAMHPDVVILATGGVLTSPGLNGSKKAKGKVLTTPELHKRVKPVLRLVGPEFLGWATRFYLPVGKKVVVVGAGLHGLEVAEFLTKRGRRVTVVEPSDIIGEGMLDFRLGLTMEWFAQEGVRIIAGAKDLVVTDKGLSFADAGGNKVELEADTLIPTAPLLPNHKLYDALQGKVPELFLIGDGQQAGMIVHAVRAGYQTAKSI